MYGFTESFNISVCAALMLRELTRRMRGVGVAWELTGEEKLDLRLSWYRQVVRGSDLIEARFWRVRDGVADH
jgi:tRNA (guanosine-2'-O-)-methyltransferase